MILFTILGLLVFWLFCWEIGYYIGMALDANARWDEYLKPVRNDLEDLIAVLSAQGIGKP